MEKENSPIVSVAMATYNGDKYIKDQIESILINLKLDDELIISDDGSTDSTLKIVKEYQRKDKRIKLFEGPRLGVKQNFANAIEHCCGKYIFLSDQDDIWMPNKVEKVLEYFRDDKYKVVVHNADIVDKNLNSIENDFFSFRKSGKGKVKNIYKNTYIGCCMAFSASLKDKILPIPNNIEMHDQWIGLIGEKIGKVFFLNENLIKYRRHDENVSSFKHYPLKRMIKNRIIFVKEYLRR